MRESFWAGAIVVSVRACLLCCAVTERVTLTDLRFSSRGLQIYTIGRISTTETRNKNRQQY